MQDTRTDLYYQETAPGYSHEPNIAVSPPLGGAHNNSGTSTPFTTYSVNPYGRDSGSLACDMQEGLCNTQSQTVHTNSRPILLATTSDSIITSV